jgi:hypothetical protein
LIGLAALVLVVALLAGVERPSRDASVYLLALAGLAAWTAVSWFWSASPASALEEAQRVTLYAVAAAAVAVDRRRVPASAAVAAAATIVACWNLASRAHGVGSSTGAGTDPVGYANGLALLCVLGLLVLPALPRATWVAVVPLAAVLVLQGSSGAYAALVVGVAVRVVRLRRLRLLAAAVGVGLLLASPYLAGGHERTHYWRVAAREAEAHPVLGSGAGTFVNWWVRDRDTTVSTEEAHSLYLETLAELGPLGLALVLLALALPVAAARRPEQAAAVAAYAAAAAVDFHWELAGVTLPALVLGAAAVSEGPPRRGLRPGLVVPACAALTTAAVLAYAGNASLSAAQTAAQRGDAAAARADARAALRWQPYSPAPWVVLGDTGPTRRARVDAYLHAVRRDRSDWSLWQRLAGVARGELRRLAREKAAQLNPLGLASGS